MIVVRIFLFRIIPLVGINGEILISPRRFGCHVLEEKQVGFNRTIFLFQARWRSPTGVELISVVQLWGWPSQKNPIANPTLLPGTGKQGGEQRRRSASRLSGPFYHRAHRTRPKHPLSPNQKDLVPRSSPGSWRCGCNLYHTSLTFSPFKVWLANCTTFPTNIFVICINC